MATVERQTAYGTIVSVMTTELNSLANNTRAISSAQGADAPSAGSEPYPLADFELVVTFGTNPTAGTYFDLFLIPSVDGTNYVDGDASIAPSTNQQRGSFGPLRAVTTAQRLALENVEMPAGLWKAVILNNATGQTIAASGNTLKMRPRSVQGV